MLLIASLCLLLCFCRQVSKSVKAEPPPESQQSKLYGPPRKVGALKDKAIDESSGLVASRSIPGKYWTHKDSGDGPFLYLINEQGNLSGVWRVAGAQAIDWADISIGTGSEAGKNYLYIADIGDNDSVRKEIVVYRAAEPAQDNGNSTKAKP